MYLKKLEMQGFKSFPEYTLIEFDVGMTAVVGPNGSGKSNVTDAVRWVLGEQSVKSLRGGKMEDVIFNGTQSRKAMNYAEVSMTLDNSDHYLDVEYDELQITRRLYRSGESEYQINHVNCRLKDIVGLFLDTGLGKDGYSIIGQGRVDEILSVKSEDRRRVIEEASGIVKYKVRKEEAERKLNSTEQNLVRIDDILNELSERVGPLKEQAEKAIKYHKTYDELKEKDVSLLVHKIKSCNEAMGGQGDLKEQLEKDLEFNENRYLEIRNSNREFSDQAEKLDVLYEDKRQELSDITEEMHDVNSDIKLNKDRLLQTNLRLESFDEEEIKIKEELERLKNEIGENNKKADSLLLKANEFQKKAEGLSEQKDSLLIDFNNSSSSQDKIRQDIDSKTTELISLKEQVSSFESKKSLLDEKIKDLASQRNSMVLALNEAETEIKDADKKFREMIESEGAVTSDIAERTEKLSELKKKDSKLLSSYEDDNRNYLGLVSKIKALTELEKRKEGYQDAVRRLLLYADEMPSVKSNIVGVLGDLISVDAEYEIAIETALAASIHNIVTKTEKQASDLINVLKEKHFGRVTFLPIENIKPRRIDDDFFETARSQIGFIGIASDLVKRDSEIDDIVENLLGKIIICDTLENARKIASKIKHSNKVITLQGDSVNQGGSLTGGSVRKDAGGLLGRGREIDELNIKAEKLNQKLSVCEAERQEIDESVHEIEKELAQLDEQLKYFSIERAKAETNYQNLKAKISETKNSIEQIDKSTSELSKEKIVSEDDLEELNLVIGETEDSITDLRENILKSDSDNKSFREKLDSVRDELNAAISDAEKVIAERNGLLNVKEVLLRQKESLESSYDQKKKDQQVDIESKAEIEKRIKDLEADYTKLSADVKVKEKEIAEVNEKKNAIDKELSGFVNKLTDCNDTINSIKNQLNTLVNKSERYIEEIDNCKNRLWEDYETTFDNALPNVIEINNQNDVSREISKLKAEIKNIGLVNPDAVEEYREVSERFEFLTNQRNDIVKAKTDLEKVIAELIEEMKLKFTEQFNIINENFKVVFEDLFNGGAAEIVLENADDVLNCAIEIKAQPPGKKLQSLSLLSGGEKCLTAIALLFAILQLRPSPFVILDEVEAALDDVNISRFTDFMHRYTAKSQFVIVTHRKGTMEACDRMYGVTMQERGISKILSMRLGDA